MQSSIEQPLNGPVFEAPAAFCPSFGSEPAELLDSSLSAPCTIRAAELGCDQPFVEILKVPREMGAPGALQFAVLENGGIANPWFPSHESGAGSVAAVGMDSDLEWDGLQLEVQEAGTELTVGDVPPHNTVPPIHTAGLGGGARGGSKQSSGAVGNSGAPAQNDDEHSQKAPGGDKRGGAGGGAGGGADRYMDPLAEQTAKRSVAEILRDMRGCAAAMSAAAARALNAHPVAPWHKYPQDLAQTVLSKKAVKRVTQAIEAGELFTGEPNSPMNSSFSKTPTNSGIFQTGGSRGMKGSWVRKGPAAPQSGQNPARGGSIWDRLYPGGKNVKGAAAVDAGLSAEEMALRKALQALDRLGYTRLEPWWLPPTTALAATAATAASAVGHGSATSSGLVGSSFNPVTPAPPASFAPLSVQAEQNMEWHNWWLAVRQRQFALWVQLNQQAAAAGAPPSVLTPKAGASPSPQGRKSVSAQRTSGAAAAVLARASAGRPAGGESLSRHSTGGNLPEQSSLLSLLNDSATGSQALDGSPASPPLVGVSIPSQTEQLRGGAAPAESLSVSPLTAAEASAARLNAPAGGESSSRTATTAMPSSRLGGAAGLATPVPPAILLNASFMSNATGADGGLTSTNPANQVNASVGNLSFVAGGGTLEPSSGGVDSQMRSAMAGRGVGTGWLTTRTSNHPDVHGTMTNAAAAYSMAAAAAASTGTPRSQARMGGSPQAADRSGMARTVRGSSMAAAAVSPKAGVAASRRRTTTGAGSSPSNAAGLAPSPMSRLAASSVSPKHGGSMSPSNSASSPFFASQSSPGLFGAAVGGGTSVLGPSAALQAAPPAFIPSIPPVVPPPVASVVRLELVPAGMEATPSIAGAVPASFQYSYYAGRAFYGISGSPRNTVVCVVGGGRNHGGDVVKVETVTGKKNMVQELDDVVAPGSVGPVSVDLKQLGF